MDKNTLKGENLEKTHRVLAKTDTVKIKFREQSKRVTATVSIESRTNNELEVLERAKKLAEKAQFYAQSMK